jgi:hypothetical protein
MMMHRPFVQGTLLQQSLFIVQTCPYCAQPGGGT